MENKKRLIIIYLSITLLALLMLILSMSFFGAEGFNWFGGFYLQTEKAQDSIAITTWALIFVGIGLSISGTAMQGITRNQLASSYSLGTIASATLAIILVDYIFKVDNPGLNIFLVLLISAIISMIFLLITFSPKVNPARVIVIGMIISIFLSSLTYILRIKFDLTAQMISFLAVDSFNATWEKFQITAPIIGVGSAFLMFLGRQIQIFETNPEKAKTLAIKQNTLRFLASFTVILIASSSVYLIGPISFIGILIPQLARMILRNQASTRKIMLLSIPLSIVILLVAQILTRAFFSYGFTINAIIAIVAGPLVIYQVVKGGDHG